MRIHAVVAVVAIPLIIPVALVARQQPASPCRSAPEYRQLDFWVGTWDVEANGKIVGSSTIELIVGECVIFENYEGATGYSGKSFNIYNASLNTWQQFWVDNRGGVLEFTGEKVGLELRYRAESKDTSGATTLHRMTFFDQGKDRVRQLWEQSKDRGATWSAVFDGLYKRKK